MQIVVLSVNYQKAPVAIRETVAFDKNNTKTTLAELYRQPEISSCAILSTCNRSEVFITTEHNEPRQFLTHWFAKTHQINQKNIVPYLSFLSDTRAINHICAVACGLNSLILGEPQILGQLKETYNEAKQARTLDKVLDKLFQHAFWTAKHIRTQTNIGNSPISVAYCGTKLAQQIFSDLSQRVALFIGANEMINLLVEHFIDQGVQQIIIANRTLKKAQNLAEHYPNQSIQAISLSQLHNELHKADIIISSTASLVPILGKGLFETALKKRKRKPIFILDIAVPRDVEPEVEQLEDIYLYTIDDLEQVINQNKENRQQESQIARQLIAEKTIIFKQWLEGLPNEKLIKNYRQNASIISQDLTQKALKRLEQGDPAKLVIKTLAEQLTNKLLHQNFQNIRTATVKMLTKCEQCVPKINQK